jgi:hypothetical protein
MSGSKGPERKAYLQTIARKGLGVSRQSGRIGEHIHIGCQRDGRFLCRIFQENIGLLEYALIVFGVSGADIRK